MDSYQLRFISNINKERGKRRETTMEFVIALALFALLVVAWGFLPSTGTAAVTTEETSTWNTQEVTAPAKA